jgi:hypothetical protein
MANIGAINSKYIKTYGVTKNHGLPWKFVTPCYQMACHVIITWKTKLILITKNNNILKYLINEINSSNQWHEAWCEVSVTSHEVLWLLVNLVAMWHATLASRDHKLLLFTKSCKNEWNFVVISFWMMKNTVKIHFWNFSICVKTFKLWYRL